MSGAGAALVGWALSSLWMAAVPGEPQEPGVDRPPLAVSERQPLDFEDVVAGIESKVSRLDPRRSGAVQIRGARDTEVQVAFALPRALAGPGGELLPIAFGPDAAGFGALPRPDQARGFDPEAPHLDRLGGNGRAFVFLGGTVSPALGQRAGLYWTTVTVTVAYVGN